MLSNKAMSAAKAVEPAYVEDVFSTYLYTGNGSTQTITNGIDLAGKGGLTWFKSRASVSNHFLFDSARGTNKYVRSQLPNAEATSTSDWISSFNSNGFSLGSNAFLNTSSESMVNWTFRKQPKFFDVVTYTGDSVAGRTVAHNLGSVPGLLIVKRLDSAGQWMVYHRSLGNTKYLGLNVTDAETTSAIVWNNTTPTSTVFTLGDQTNVNNAGTQYVAYLFAHDAGGFGLSGNENVVSCGSFTTDGSGNASVTLGYEPQFWLYKPVGTGGWTIYDTMRGWAQTQIRNLNPNTSDAEGGGSATLFYPTATGFDCVGGALPASASFIYIAIRRGPMKVPTLGTTVYNAITRTGTGATAQITGVGFPPDAVWGKRKDANYGRHFDRLRGANRSLVLPASGEEANPSDSLNSYNMDGFSVGADLSEHINAVSIPYVYWNFRRAPGFFDEVCYTGTGSARTVAHNLAAVPELMIVRRRAGSEAGGIVGYWITYASPVGNNKVLLLNTTDNAQAAGMWNNTTPTSTTFTVDNNYVNYSGDTYVSYLFATCAGVSKVGSYTGTGTTQAIACGFTAGARFVMIKRTDSTGDWYVWDSARGIVAGNDPYLLLSTLQAETTGTDYIDPSSAGFEISSTAPAAINASGGSYIFLAVA